jgi:hypothetical protein
VRLRIGYRNRGRLVDSMINQSKRQNVERYDPFALMPNATSVADRKF